MKWSLLVSDILRNACWAGEVSSKGSQIGCQCCPCGVHTHRQTERQTESKWKQYLRHSLRLLGGDN